MEELLKRKGSVGTLRIPVLSQMMRASDVEASEVLCLLVNTPWFSHHNLNTVTLGVNTTYTRVSLIDWYGKILPVALTDVLELCRNEAGKKRADSPTGYEGLGDAP